MTHSYTQNPSVPGIVRQFETIPSDVLSEALWPSHLNPRKPQTKRREACLTLLGVLLRHLDGPSLRIGTQVPGVGFVTLDMKTIAQEAGLGLRRCERAIQFFLAQGFIEVTKPQGGKSIIKHSGMRAIRSITPALIACLESAASQASQASDFFLPPGQSSFGPSSPLECSREGWPASNSNTIKSEIADIVRRFESIPFDVLSEALWPSHLNLRKIRSERREACLTLLGVLLRYLDGPNLRIGNQVPGVGFVALDMETIVQESGLGSRRCERAIQICLAHGFIEGKKSQGGENVIKYSGLRAIRSITPALIACLESAVESLNCPASPAPEKSELNPNGGKP